MHGGLVLWLLQSCLDRIGPRTVRFHCGPRCCFDSTRAKAGSNRGTSGSRTVHWAKHASPLDAHAFLHAAPNPSPEPFPPPVAALAQRQGPGTRLGSSPVCAAAVACLRALCAQSAACVPCLRPGPTCSLLQSSPTSAPEESLSLHRNPPHTAALCCFLSLTPPLPE